MSSILEALKKLEAEKQPVLSVEPEHVTTAVPEFTSDTLLNDRSDPPPAPRTLLPLLWVLGGGVFTLMIIGVAVLFMMLLLQRERPAHVNPSPAAALLSAHPVVPQSIDTPTKIPETTMSEQGTRDQPVLPTEKTPTPKTSAPDPPHVTTEIPITVAQLPDPVQEMTSPTPVPAPRASLPLEKAPELPRRSTVNAEPLPKDIRSLPMLSRDERSQYRLEGMQLNMLNPAGPTRPIGNAFINLEKVFIGEFLPGSNAKLIDVKSYGIAIEIKSTGQRYYIPR